jgi:hypothetical protein
MAMKRTHERAGTGSSTGTFLGSENSISLQKKAKALDYWIDVF